MTIETFLAPAQVALMAPLVNRLAGAFEREKILYSHWKSNIHLAKGTAGDIDLDLLVDRRCLPRALSILADLGFKAAVARWGADSPGISHFYGFDEQTEALIHVHLFSIVLTGESYVKSHLLPFEAMLLENVTYLGPLRVTNKEAELVLFTLRALIKYGSFPDLLSVWNKADTLREEVRWLSDGGDLEAALSLLRRHCPPIDERLFVRCVETLEGDNSLLSRIVLARQVRRRLRVYARHGFFGRTLAYGQLLWAEAQRRARPKRKNKALKAGGALIALVGAEATGKSTLVAETGRWLGSTFALKIVHAGKPPTTFLTAPVSLLLPLLRRALSSLRTNRLEGHSAPSRATSPLRKPAGLASLAYAVRAVILAWERRQLLSGARRAAANGEIVICDRYPSDRIGAMDSPRLREQGNQGGAAAAIFNRLARLERQLYQQIAPPDIVLRLHVSMETAQKRNRERVKAGKESDAYVASRHSQAREWQKTGTQYVFDVDTERPLAETILSVKKAIWESL